MTVRRRDLVAIGVLGPFLPSCATTYARFREPPGPEWGCVIASTAIELPSALQITSCAFGGTMAGTGDNFMLSTNVAMISQQKLDVATPELSATIGVQPLPPGRYAINHIGYHANALQSWRTFNDIFPPQLEMQSRTAVYVGEYKATRSGSMKVFDQSLRDLPLALAKRPELRRLALRILVPGVPTRDAAWPSA